ncbi:MAG: hypothetical protein M3198_05270 [Actinomycetota bacterium]|nr:hypothetical protein [Actinomycetota bacterium]
MARYTKQLPDLALATRTDLPIRTGAFAPAPSVRGRGLRAAVASIRPDFDMVIAKVLVSEARREVFATTRVG